MDHRARFVTCTPARSTRIYIYVYIYIIYTHAHRLDIYIYKHSMFIPAETAFDGECSERDHEDDDSDDGSCSEPVFTLPQRTEGRRTGASCVYTHVNMLCMNEWWDGDTCVCVYVLPEHAVITICTLHILHYYKIQTSSHYTIHIHTTHIHTRVQLLFVFHASSNVCSVLQG
jgi:hypothetical protein